MKFAGNFGISIIIVRSAVAPHFAGKFSIKFFQTGRFDYSIQIDFLQLFQLFSLTFNDPYQRPHEVSIESPIKTLFFQWTTTGNEIVANGNKHDSVHFGFFSFANQIMTEHDSAWKWLKKTIKIGKTRQILPNPPKLIPVATTRAVGYNFLMWSKTSAMSSMLVAQ